MSYLPRGPGLLASTSTRRWGGVLAFSALSISLLGCPKIGRADPSDAGSVTTDTGVASDAASTGDYDPIAGLPFDGPLVLDDARLRAIDPTTLRAGTSPCRAPILARVTHVTDGDTITVNGLSETLTSQRVRMIGVDAPEIAHDGMTAECYGDEASAFSAQLDGHQVWLTFDGTCYDPFDRLLAYVHVGGGEGDLWERQLLRRGFARVLIIGANDMFGGQFRTDANLAEAEPTGLWRDCP